MTFSIVGRTEQPASGGAGDVEISTSRHDGANTVQVTLKARQTYAVPEAQARTTAAFLERTCQALPLGTEHRRLDPDLARQLVQDVG
ncbi:SsgA family sporulation/cell division regulator [Streptomyces sp. NPDC058741]|uniref:SsgA family sporulation/cell division regulator n=1 Tax=Streptomyces sp. NPDC058741 TaxID=3346620 RepID=UPI00368E7EC2